MNVIQVGGATVGRHELIPLADRAAWMRAVSKVPHGFAHTWGHCQAFALSSGLPTFLYHFESGPIDVICPLSERRFGGEPDVVTPYGFGGFAASGPVPGFSILWREFASAQGWVCGYLQCNPLLNDPLSEVEPVRLHNEIYVVDLERPDSDLVDAMSATRRRQLRDGPGPESEIRPAGPDAVGFLIANAPSFFAARAASSVYQFAPATWMALLSADGVLALEARAAGVLEAVTVFGLAGSIADYLFNVSTTGGQRFSAHLLWEGIRQLRDGGSRLLNLGGGMQADDNVAKFKRRFGARTLPLGSIRQVFRSNAFERLCLLTGVAADTQSSYFPPYYSRQRS